MELRLSGFQKLYETYIICLLVHFCLYACFNQFIGYCLTACYLCLPHIRLGRYSLRKLLWTSGALLMFVSLSACLLETDTVICVTLHSRNQHRQTLLAGHHSSYSQTNLANYNNISRFGLRHMVVMCSSCNLLYAFS